ncbi:MAG: Ig domain-containing protein [Planctomycetota bacterium]
MVFGRSISSALLALVFLVGCSEEDEPSFPPLVITPASIPDALEGWTFDTTINASGGTNSGYSWSVSTGTLPLGIVLSSQGTPGTSLSGTATENGTFSFTILVQDDSGNSAAGDLTLEVLPAGSLYITTTSLSDGAAGTAYGENLDATGGTGCGYTWSVSAGTLPPGLTLGGNDGALNWNAFSSTGNVDQSLSPELTEISGVAASRLNPGCLWVHDDSGAGADFYALDEGGNVLQKYHVSIAAQDWEDICIGPGPDPNKEYLYLGDFGDNGVSRTNCRIVRVEEPTVPAAPQSTITLPHEAFYFLYPGGPRNCETVLVDWETAVIYLCEKVGAPGNVYKFPGAMDSAWSASSPVTLTQVTSSGVMPNTLTGGGSSRDGRRVIVRGYGSTCWEYARPS